MRIEEGSLLERLNQKRERRLSTPFFAFRIFSLFTDSFDSLVVSGNARL